MATKRKKPKIKASPPKVMTVDERNLYSKAFRASSGKRLGGRTADAKAALKAHRDKKKKK